MRYLITYNESVRDKMTPKSNDDIISNFDNAEDYEKKKFILGIVDERFKTPEEFYSFVQRKLGRTTWKRLSKKLSSYSKNNIMLLDEMTDDDKKYLLKCLLYLTPQVTESVRSKMTPKSTEDMIPLIVDRILDNYTVSPTRLFMSEVSNHPKLMFLDDSTMDRMMGYGNGIYLSIMDPQYQTVLREFFWKKNIAFSRITSTEYKIMSHDKIRLVLSKLVEDVFSGVNQSFSIQKFTDLMR